MKPRAKTISGRTMPFFLSLSLILTLPAARAGLNDDFEGALDPVKWSLQDASASSAMVVSSGTLNYVNSLPASQDDYAVLHFSGVRPGYDESWEVVVDVTNTALRAGSEQYTGAGIGILGGEHSNRYDEIFLELGNERAPSMRFAANFITDDQDSPDADAVLDAGVNDGSLRIAFNGATKVFSVWVDRTGSSDGLQWESLASYGIAGVGGIRNTQWNMTSAGTFLIGLYGLSSGLAVGEGIVTFDNFAFTKEGASPPPDMNIGSVTVTATSELSTGFGRTVAGLTDGTFGDDGTALDLGSVWESSGIGFQDDLPDDHAPAITFAFDRVYQVRKIRLWNFPEAPVAIRRVAVEISQDGDEFTFLREAGEIAGSGQGHHDIELNGPTARYLRLRILENWGGDIYPVEPGTAIKGFAGFAGLLEVRLYGELESGVPDEAPTILQPPLNTATTVGQDAQFTVVAISAAPLTYQWRKDGLPMTNGGNILGADTATLTLANVQAGDAGGYDVVVSNAVGSMTSEVAVLLVEDAAGSGKITGVTATATSELAAYGRVADSAVNGVYLDSYFWESVGVGHGFGEDRNPAITFDLQAVHRLEHLLIWNSHEPAAAIKRMRTELSDDGVMFTAIPGEFMLQTTLDPQKLALGGRLARFVRFDILENHSDVTFPVSGTPSAWSLVAIDEVEFFGWLNDQTPVAPNITQEPGNLIVTAGQTAQFSVKAAGTSPLTFQWRKAGAALTDGGGVSGATSPTLTLASAQAGDAGIYDVTVSNSLGNDTSSPAMLTVIPPPEAPAVLQHPVSTTGVQGQTVTLSVTAVGTAPMAYQWFYSAIAGGPEVPVSGATSPTITLAALSTAQAGAYRVRVSNAANPGGVFSKTANVAVTLLERGFVTRLLPGAYIPGQPFEVVLEARPLISVAFHAVWDQPPAGWTISAINEGGTFDGQTGRVKFGPFADNASRTLRYTVLPPADAAGSYAFVGMASADGVDGDIRGSGAIENSLNHPADLDGDRRLVITEITGYGAAWKQAAAWSLPPNPIPVNYVTRAGFLWRNGERYRFDPAAGTAPLWWAAETSPAPAQAVTRLAMNTAVQAARAFTGHVVTVAAAPAATVQVYAVEERLFANFTATGISHGGVFLPEQGLIRWGPFFDNQPRTFSYSVTAPADFNGEIAALGLVSMDGNSVPVAGDSVLRFGTGELPLPVTPELDKDSLRFDITGPLNARVVIETANFLGDPWTVATEFELNKQNQSWSVPLEIQESQNFFRVRVLAP